MKTAKTGSQVEVYYRGMMMDGGEFESNFEKEAFKITIGETKLIKGFTNALIGMREGQTKNITIKPKDGYGFYNSELIATLDKTELPPNTTPAVGWFMKIGKMKLKVKAMTDTTVTLDGNHPLAGIDIKFEINMIKIID